MKKINMPTDVEYILDTLINSGYESYIVGGCVRDEIMNVIPSDWDITTSAKPNEVKKIFKHTFDTGIEHGTITVVLNKKNYEVTTFRIDGEYEDNRRPKEVFYTKNLEEDLRRRDFTINAIAYNGKTSYIDPFNGILDIENGIIRGVGNPAKRFEEDALRMIRAIRFSGKTGFKIDNETYEAIISHNYLLSNISAERIRVEFEKLILSKNPQKFEMLVETELIKYFDKYFFEYLRENRNFIKEFINNNQERLYAYGILFCKMKDEDIFKIMQKFKFDNITIKNVRKIVIGLNKNISENEFSVRKFISEFGKDISLIIINIKKILGIDMDFIYNEYVNTVKNNYPITIKDLEINGNDIKNLGISKGKLIGDILNNTLDFVLEFPIRNNFEEIKAFIINTYL